MCHFTEATPIPVNPNMKASLEDLKSLFEEAKANVEFEFVLTLLNYRGMGPQLSPVLHEWFEAIEFYKSIYVSFKGKEKARMAALLYSTFFESSDFYNMIGSLCRIALGYKGSSYLFWKTRKYERLLGIGEKQDFLIELLADAGKEHIISFFTNKHFKEIRNTYFHAAYHLDEQHYYLHDSDPVVINHIGTSMIELEGFFYPLVNDVIQFFDEFKSLYQEHWMSYQADKPVPGLFPDPVVATILGSEQGLQGFRIKNAVQFYGKWHDSGIWYDDAFELWSGHNLRMTHADIEAIEISDQLKRYEGKANINRSDADFNNLVDMVKERDRQDEMARAVLLLEKFADVRKDMMDAETDPFKKRSFPKMILPLYQQAVELGKGLFDLAPITKKIKAIEAII